LTLWFFCSEFADLSNYSNLTNKFCIELLLFLLIAYIDGNENIEIGLFWAVYCKSYNLDVKWTDLHQEHDKYQ